ncbi:MAG TPA: metallophosphoesterase [Roseiflexaceae bacterium]|nr:metallophosphoesterase [Roseiflexaceae bacterium]
MTNTQATIRIAAVSDIHCSRTSQGTLQPLFSQVAELADILILAGDLTDYGLEEEARILIAEMAPVARMPTVAVLGNHDFESGHPENVRDMLCDAGVTMLDGETCEFHGVGFAGIKGFGGGFGRGTLGFWGEPATKSFVQEAIDEALKLETALARLRNERRVVVMHYSPIAATVAGEPPEIFPFLGCSRLEEPLMRYPVDVVVHGHAHGGSPEGRTSGGIPVYNVAHALLQRALPDRPALRMLEMSLAPENTPAPTR